MIARVEKGGVLATAIASRTLSCLEVSPKFSNQMGFVALSGDWKLCG